MKIKSDFFGYIFQLFNPFTESPCSFVEMDYLSRTVGICFLVIESLKVVRKRIPILSHRGFHPPSWSKPVCPRIVVIDSKDGENTSELSTASRNVEKSDRNFSKMFYSSSVYSKSFHGGETSISNSSPKKLKIEPSLRSSNFVNRYKDKSSNIAFLIDTGSDVSVLPASISERRRGKRMQQLSAANTSPINVYGEAPPENKRNMRPNYFVAVQISSPIIHQAVQNIQNHIVNQNMQFNDCMISVLTLHITLMVMSIDNKETYDRAIKALQNVYMEHNDVMCKKPLQLEFCGLGHFHNRVLYAKIKENESFKRFCDLAECVRKHFADVEIFSTEERKFNPHLTIAKLNFSKKTQRALKKIAPALYEIFIDEYIGIETIRGIQLLSMTSPKDSVGYYKGDNLIFESSSSTPPEISATSSYDSKLNGFSDLTAEKDNI